MEERKAGTNSTCPFYRGVRLIEVSVKRESTVLRKVYEFSSHKKKRAFVIDRSLSTQSPSATG